MLLEAVSGALVRVDGRRRHVLVRRGWRELLAEHPLADHHAAMHRARRLRQSVGGEQAALGEQAHVGVAVEGHLPEAVCVGGGSEGAQEVEVDPAIRLQHMIVIEFFVAPSVLWCDVIGGLGTPAFQFGIID